MADLRTDAAQRLGHVVRVRGSVVDARFDQPLPEIDHLLRLERLRTEHQLLRQTEITEELLDVVSGFEVLRTE